MKGVRHLIECHCVLPQYRRRDVPIFHKFPVFSKIDDQDIVEEKVVQCENCGTIHRVYDICKSEIIPGKDDSRVALTIEDIKISMSDKLSNILDSYDCDISLWEHVEFIIENEEWGSEVILKRESQADATSLKILQINGNDKLRIKTATRKESV